LLSLVLLLFLITGGAARADSLSAGFDSANKLYDAGKFAEAATAFEKLTVSGQSSAALYFNLGNAFFKSGRIGRAIAAYRQAERLAPRDPDVQANLQFARNQVQGPALAPNHWQRWLARLTLNEWALLAAAAVWLWFILLALLQWRPGLKPALRNYVILTGAAGALLCAGLGCAYSETRPARMAVVIARDVPVRGGPLDEAKTAFTLQDGAEVRVLDQKDDWLQVTTDPRRIGWLRRNQILLN
jgi:tetratricopeptide (TPR) repeat protein